MVRKRSEEELRSILAVQIEALRDSCASYDNGKTWEALRLATTTFVLVHDTGSRAKSVLGQLGAKNSMLFLASAEALGPNEVGMPPLVSSIAKPGEASYVPKLGRFPANHSLVSFKDWWQRQLIFKNGPNTITRKRLTFGLRNMDGGAHYDEEIRKPDYAAVADNKMSSIRHRDGVYRTVPGLQHAMMRQVAWELLESLKTHGLYSE